MNNVENKYPVEGLIGHICSSKDKDPDSKCCGVCISGFDSCECLNEWEVEQSKMTRFGQRVWTCEDCPKSVRHLEVYIVVNRLTKEKKKLCEGCTEPYFKYFNTALEMRYLKLKDNENAKKRTNS